VASHLTVTTAANPGVAVKGLNAQASATPANDVFAALLGDSAPAEPTNEPAKAATVALAAGGLIELALGQDGGADEKPDETPDPVAVPIDAVVPIQQPVSPQALLTGIIDGLTALRAAAQNGQLPSADDLAKLNQSLDALAGALGLSLDDLPSMDDLAAMAAQPLPAGATLEDQLIATLAPMAQGVLTDAAKAATTDTAMADQLKAIGDKLAALLKGLEGGAIDLDAMAGNTDKAPLGADLQAALDRLLKPAAAALAAATTTQVFTPPKLEITEPTLAGKTVDAAAPVDAPDTTTTSASTKAIDPVLKADAGAADAKDQRDKAKDAKIDAVVTATAKAAAADAPAAVQASIHTAARIEATPGPRPVIAGYQTSQQQLNLPQIAFELVRQVSDGNSRFQMRLDPPELGKIDVRLDIDRSGQVTARLTVEKAETLDLMQRDQRGLEKALQQAGLDSSKTNLEFSLKQNPFSGSQQGQDQGGRQPGFGGDTAAEADEPPAPQINLYRASLSASGVNIIA
jgi:flagellar hook-length control protein FliK